MSMTTVNKDRIYDHLSNNKIKFIYKKDISDRIKSMNFLLSSVSELSFTSIEECFDFLTNHWDKKCKNDKCSKNRKIGSIFPNRSDFLNIVKKYGIYKFCEDSRCNYESISKRQSGENNTCHKMTDESFKSMCSKNSIKMKQNIREGKFIPNVTNSWAKSRCEIEFYREDVLIKIKTRSTWDAYFQIFNPSFVYEKVVIPYKLNNVCYNYIVDFVDYDNKIIYEIKPISNISDKKNKCKMRYARKWCKLNGYKMSIITESWFKKNYEESLIIDQPCEDKMKRNLKQFK